MSIAVQPRLEAPTKGKKSPVSQRRNVGIMAHIDAGKTTVTERILKITGRIHRMGEVHDGAATMDYMEEERARGITITAAAVNVEWRDNVITIIDTPGHVDFTVEVERSMRVLDGAVCVFDGSEGVEPQSETVWRQAERYGVPRLCFINKMDKAGADFREAVESIRTKLGARVVPVQIPIGEAEHFRGLVDLVLMKGFEYTALDERHEVDIPPELQDWVDEARTELLEAVSEQDDALMEKYLAGEKISIDEVSGALRSATIANDLQPVFCGSALRDKGIMRLCDGIVAFLPGPTDLPPVRATTETGEIVERPPTPDAKACALAFKTVHDKTGDLTYLRIYSGTLRRGDSLWNTRKHKQERIGRLLVMKADEREAVDQAVAGEIVAAIGLKDATTGDTLCTKDEPISLEAMDFPEAVISVAIEPKSRGDRDKLGDVLNSLTREDPSLRHFSDPETGDTVLAGMGELHLEVVVNRIRGEFKIPVEVGAPRVAYRMRLRRECDIEGKHVKQSGGRGQFAVVHVKFGVGEEQELEFIDSVVGGRVPREYINPVKKGIAGALSQDPETGFPYVQVTAELYDGKAHSVDSSELAFSEAGRIAFRAAVAKAGTTLLEPIMRITVVTPAEFMGDVIGSVNARRAEIEKIEERGTYSQIIALVPLAEMFSYATSLRSMTTGRGTYTMEPHTYSPVPESLGLEVLKEAREAREKK